MTLEEFHTRQKDPRWVFDMLQAAVAAIGSTELRVSKSQISFRLPDSSPRWKPIMEPYPGRFTHHLGLYKCEEIDVQVCQWLRQVWEAGA